MKSRRLKCRADNARYFGLNLRSFFDTLAMPGNIRLYFMRCDNESHCVVDGIPILLAVIFSFTWFFPYRDRLIGWGGDPAFNLWTLEQVWKQLSTLGVHRIFSS